jgi:hypothetical protein
MNSQSKLIAESSVDAGSVNYATNRSDVATRGPGSAPDPRESDQVEPESSGQSQKSEEDSNSSPYDYVGCLPRSREERQGVCRPPKRPIIVRDFLQNLSEEIALLCTVKRQIEETISRSVSQGLKMSSLSTSDEKNGIKQGGNDQLKPSSSSTTVCPALGIDH